MAQEPLQLNNVIYFKRRQMDIVPPVQSETLVGIDIRAPFDFMLCGQDFKTVDLNYIVKIPKDKYGRITGVYDLALTKGIDVVNGIIGPNYRKTLKICVLNRSDEDVQFKEGDVIARLTLEKNYLYPIEERYDLDYAVEDVSGKNYIIKTEPPKAVINPAIPKSK
ncbi:DUTPASE [Rachiplusia nu nucleopolyhedrovirus]|uniref:dUTP diphosphatase n=1 Tax=Rachiplusia nu nucleopolyhedrovirus TaxID=2605775 RepID=A0AAF1DB61_9ABAC|nr:DUTPASE [Rachiplusia nu nucleopolyhedrovirus]QEI03691.1 DUTPASE [Rachiplusia nu nucleopolyhedrovirus]